jgi:hypothetical protein
MKSRTYMATFGVCAVAALAPAAQAHNGASYKSSSISYYQSGATKTILAAMRKGSAVRTNTSGVRPDDRSGTRGV